MKIISLNCPKCGGKLDDIKIADGKSDLFCNYCGNHILLENENHQVFEHRTVDEARIRELELELEKYRDDRSKKKMMLKVSGVLAMIGSILLLCGIFNSDFLVFGIYAFLFCVCCFIVAVSNEPKQAKTDLPELPDLPGNWKQKKHRKQKKQEKQTKA